VEWPEDGLYQAETVEQSPKICTVQLCDCIQNNIQSCATLITQTPYFQKTTL